MLNMNKKLEQREKEGVRIRYGTNLRKSAEHHCGIAKISF